MPAPCTPKKVRVKGKETKLNCRRFQVSFSAVDSNCWLPLWITPLAEKLELAVCFVKISSRPATVCH